ncbi:AP-3 complex subunit delta [Cryomyces antarcticus]
MFEKSLYDLIRGLRNHKGSEREYIQDSLKECRKEIRSQDMDLKATALLKLTYLEMFGHDMSWASFNVLEVMSSQKYLQKRVGYLGAVQSFRPDTEVLMLAENLLKKDLNSPLPPTISLPLVAIPHVINPSMANSLLSDLLPRLIHSQPAIRKKTIVTLYRLALVYPETLRPAWPKIKERLLDENEDPSVTAAIINVVCELGWRRPQDFLPLAPRLFDLLVQGGNNWMAIKIIKLFATLTPLEPRLVKKLLPPLTSLIKTTPAMSLLYECVNSIIQGGILDGAAGTTEGDEVARLCVGKLRGMLVVEGDANLRYVALLTFNKIVISHPQLVSLHQDVILECIDDPDVSIRLRALDLVVAMVNSDNLAAIVGRLMRQLRNAPIVSTTQDPANDRGAYEGIVPTADPDDAEAEESLRRREKTSDQPPPLPEEYRINVIRRTLEMCSRDTYVNINDFEWYIDILVQLVRYTPATVRSSVDTADSTSGPTSDSKTDMGYEIGLELQNVAVRVRSVRQEATRAAQSLVLVDGRESMFPASGNGGQGVLESAVWIVGEYADLLPDPDATMTSLLHVSTAQLPARLLAVYIQAVPKVFTSLASNQGVSWTAHRKSTIILLMARIVHFLEPLATHPSLEVQERAVEYLELMRLASEAALGQDPEVNGNGFVDPPLLLTQAMPSLFTGVELNPVARGAQKKVPLPDDLDLDLPINENLSMILQLVGSDLRPESDEDDVFDFYNKRPQPQPQVAATAADRLEPSAPKVASYQQGTEDQYLDPDILARRKAERAERYKDDPFYIDSSRNSGTSTPLHNILKNSNGEELDIDAIPIMDLDLESASDSRDKGVTTRVSGKRKPRKNIDIVADETIGFDDETSLTASRPAISTKGKKSLLEVDSSGLQSLSLEGGGESQLDIERRETEEAEMAKAMREVERLRLEMQRAQERIHAKDVPDEGTLVKRKKKKAKPQPPEPEAVAPMKADEEPAVRKKKKKKKPKNEGGDDEGTRAEQGVETVEVKPKKKKKKWQAVVEEAAARDV